MNDRIKYVEPFLDEDGYPTTEQLELIKNWDFTDRRALFDYISELWWTGSSLISTETQGKSTLYYFSTGGWSGNESIIHYLKLNTMFWLMCWVQSRRGGHYIFEYKPLKDEIDGNNI